jgi:hypothetical protein
MGFFSRDKAHEWRMRLKILPSLFTRPEEWRFVPLWFWSFRENYMLDNACPWLSFKAIRFIRKRVKAGDKVFEYGTGASTLFWLKCGASCVSVEHDPQWHETILLKTRGNPNLDYRLVPPEKSPFEEGDFSDPDLYISSAPEFKGYSFRDYATQIDSFPDGHFDWILVDGRARPSCIKHSAPKLRKGGYLIVDNAERTHYTEKAGIHLEGYRRLVFEGLAPNFNQRVRTDIFQKPIGG